MKNRNGFSLIELLGTIIVLGIIVTITIYTGKSQIDKSKKNGFKEDLRAIIRGTEIYKEENDLYDFTISVTELNIKNITGFTGNVVYADNVVTLVNITNQEFCGNGTSENLVIEPGSCN